MKPILYSFRRCPYAMRARLAVASSGQGLELREVILRDKPSAFLEASPTATVPCLVTPQGVIDESLDIMKWALTKNDPEGWLDMPKEGWEWINRADGPFKDALDRTKYATRYPNLNPIEQRAIAAAFLTDLDRQIGTWVFHRPTIADYAILPFVRQFAFIDKPWFDAQAWPDLHRWLECFLVSDRFEKIWERYAKWQEGDPPTLFP
jgi:glutathione S-transferase